MRYGAEHQDDRFPAAYPFHPKGERNWTREDSDMSNKIVLM
ncbi:MAG: hypothetical protein ACLR23_16065 [Clostridia bacterium]